MLENSASRTRSVVGRVVGPEGVASRLPPAVPPMMRVIGWSRLLHEVALPGRLHHQDTLGQKRVSRQGLVLVEQLLGCLPRSDDRLLVAQHLEVLQARSVARLRTPEHVALAALLEVDPAELAG